MKRRFGDQHRRQRSPHPTLHLGQPAVVGQLGTGENHGIAMLVERQHAMLASKLFGQEPSGGGVRLSAAQVENRETRLRAERRGDLVLRHVSQARECLSQAYASAVV